MTEWQVAPQAISVPSIRPEGIIPLPPTLHHTACLQAPLYLLPLVKGLPWSGWWDKLCMYWWNWKWWGAQHELFLNTGNNTYKNHFTVVVTQLAGMQTALKTNGYLKITLNKEVPLLCPIQVCLYFWSAAKGSFRRKGRCQCFPYKDTWMPLPKETAWIYVMILQRLKTLRAQFSIISPL